MSNKHGFVLFECIIYFCLLVIVTSLTINWALITHAGLKTQSKLCIKHMNILAAQDFLMRQLRAAPAAKYLWKKMESDQLIWLDHDIDRGLLKEGDKLFLVQGHYNEVLSDWKDMHKSLISDSINTLLFSIATNVQHGTEFIKNIIVTCNDTELLIAVRNGAL
jgi:hypothetical protein